jgi:triosephosphate isomerase
MKNRNKKFLFVINFKTYKESTGKKAEKIFKIVKEIEKKANSLNVEMIVSPSYIDLKEGIKEGLNVFSQHFDNIDYGAHTGFIPGIMLKDNKIKGSLINHSEHRIKFDEIKDRILCLKNLKLKSIVCVENAREVKKISKLEPDYIAIEPKELIGGNISISSAHPELITDSIKNSNNIPILIGAGIKTKEDVLKGLEHGAKGILVASGIVKAKNIKKEIEDLLDAFKNFKDNN